MGYILWNRLLLIMSRNIKKIEKIFDIRMVIKKKVMSFVARTLNNSNSFALLADDSGGEDDAGPAFARPETAAAAAAPTEPETERDAGKVQRKVPSAHDFTKLWINNLCFVKVDNDSFRFRPFHYTGKNPVLHFAQTGADGKPTTYRAVAPLSELSADGKVEIFIDPFETSRDGHPMGYVYNIKDIPGCTFNWTFGQMRSTVLRRHAKSKDHTIKAYATSLLEAMDAGVTVYLDKDDMMFRSARKVKKVKVFKAGSKAGSKDGFKKPKRTVAAAKVEKPVGIAADAAASVEVPPKPAAKPADRFGPSFIARERGHGIGVRFENGKYVYSLAGEPISTKALKAKGFKWIKTPCGAIVIDNNPAKRDTLDTRKKTLFLESVQYQSEHLGDQSATKIMSENWDKIYVVKTADGKLIWSKTAEKAKPVAMATAACEDEPEVPVAMAAAACEDESEVPVVMATAASCGDDVATAPSDSESEEEEVLNFAKALATRPKPKARTPPARSPPQLPTEAEKEVVVEVVPADPFPALPVDPEWVALCEERKAEAKAARKAERLAAKAKAAEVETEVDEVEVVPSTPDPEPEPVVAPPAPSRRKRAKGRKYMDFNM